MGGADPPHRKESAEVVHPVRMPPGRRPRGRTRTHWRVYISHLARERLWEKLDVTTPQTVISISCIYSDTISL